MGASLMTPIPSSGLRESLVCFRVLCGRGSVRIIRPSTPPLYNGAFEHDGCGTGFVATIDGKRSHRIVELAVRAVVNLTHRGAVSADASSGDGAGVTIQIPHELLAEDALIFGLRMNAGVNVVAWRRRAPSAPWEKIAAQWRALEEQGLLECAGEVVRLTDRGRLLADAVGVRIMEVFEPDAICG